MAETLSITRPPAVATSTNYWITLTISRPSITTYITAIDLSHIPTTAPQATPSRSSSGLSGTSIGAILGSLLGFSALMALLFWYSANDSRGPPVSPPENPPENPPDSYPGRQRTIFTIPILGDYVKDENNTWLQIARPVSLPAKYPSPKRPRRPSGSHAVRSRY